MRDSSSVPVILSFRSQIRIANRSSSLRPESSGAWDSVCFGGAGFSLGSAASMECILTEAWLSGHWPGHGPLVEYWGDGILGLSGREAQSCRILDSPLRRDGARALRDFTFQLVFDAAVIVIGVRHRFAILFRRYITVDLEHVAVGIVEIDALCHAVKDCLAKLHVVFFGLSIDFLQLGKRADFE